MQFPGENPLPFSDGDKIKVINKIKVADSESDFGLHGKALVSEIFAFYVNKSDIHFAISSNSGANKSFNRRYMLILFEEIAKFMSLLFE